jgi:hypothetical protein
MFVLLPILAISFFYLEHFLYKNVHICTLIFAFLLKMKFIFTKKSLFTKTFISNEDHSILVEV